MVNKKVISILSENKIKITPQRIAVLDVIFSINSHPDADQIIKALRTGFPHLAAGTVYKILDLFVEKGIIKKVKTDGGTFRYDHITMNHHHLYCAESDRIEDYYDEELDRLISEYFEKHRLPNFTINDIKLNLIGNFNDKKADKS